MPAVEPTIRAWIEKADPAAASADADRDELRRLRKEIRRLQQEHDIGEAESPATKAAAWFARETGSIAEVASAPAGRSSS